MLSRIRRFCPDRLLRRIDAGARLRVVAAGTRIILLHVLEGFLDDVDPQQIRAVNVFEYLHHSEQDALQRLNATVPEEARARSRSNERIARGWPTGKSWTCERFRIPRSHAVGKQ